MSTDTTPGYDLLYDIILTESYNGRQAKKACKYNISHVCCFVGQKIKTFFVKQVKI